MNRIDVTVYEFTSKNFTKHGFLSKRARPIIDDQNCETIGMDAEALAIRQRLPRIASIEAPYVFNHIRINTEDGRRRDGCPDDEYNTENLENAIEECQDEDIPLRIVARIINRVLYRGNYEELIREMQRL